MQDKFSSPKDVSDILQGGWNYPRTKASGIIRIYSPLLLVLIP